MDKVPTLRDKARKVALGAVGMVVGAVTIVGWAPIYAVLVVKMVRGPNEPELRMMPEEEQHAETPEPNSRVHRRVRNILRRRC